MQQAVYSGQSKHSQFRWGIQVTKQNQNLLNLSSAAAAAGVTRKTLYSHIDKGLLSVTRQHGKRYIDVSELIRHYGTVSLPDEKVSNVTQSLSKQNSGADSDALVSIQKELAALREIVERQQLLLEDQANSKRIQDELQQTQDTLSRVRAELEAERGKGWFKRLFKD